MFLNWWFGLEAAVSCSFQWLREPIKLPFQSKPFSGGREGQEEGGHQSGSQGGRQGG